MDVKKTLEPFSLFSSLYNELNQIVIAIKDAGGTQEDARRLLGPLYDIQGTLINIAIFLKNTATKEEKPEEKAKTTQ